MTLLNRQAVLKRKPKWPEVRRVFLHPTKRTRKSLLLHANIRRGRVGFRQGNATTGTRWHRLVIVHLYLYRASISELSKF